MQRHSSSSAPVSPPSIGSSASGSGAGVFEDVASVSFPLRSNEYHCIPTITIEGPRFQFDVEDSPLLADWVSMVALLEAEVQKDPARFASPFADLAPSELRFP